MFSGGYKQLVRTLCAAAGLAFAMHGGLAMAASLPDPTRPPQRFVELAKRVPAVSDHWRLGSILIAPQRRVAVINGQSMSLGEQLNGAQLVSIEPGRVCLRRGTKEIVLELLTVRPTRSAVGEQNP